MLGLRGEKLINYPKLIIRVITFELTQRYLNATDCHVVARHGIRLHQYVDDRRQRHCDSNPEAGDVR